MKELRCDCKSDERSLVLLAGDLENDYPEIVTFGEGAGWQFFPEFGALQIELGTGSPISGVTELLNFLRGAVDGPRLEALRAVWVSRQDPLENQLAKLIHAGVLVEMVPADSSPLLKMLQERRVDTWFQPILRADSGALWGYECLMRGRTSTGELIYPDQIIAWAKQENLTSMMDRICRETHLLNAGTKLRGSTANVLINFMPTAIYDPEFCLKTTVAAATKGGITADRIIFEVIETEKITDMGQLRSILDYYRRMGFRVALDDLGSGYSGLAVLGDLDPDLIKIDRQLISNAVASPMHRSICNSLVQLGKTLGKLVLAEGVETLEEKELLKGMGVDLFQGYLFGRPSPIPFVPALT